MTKVESTTIEPGDLFVCDTAEGWIKLVKPYGREYLTGATKSSTDFTTSLAKNLNPLQFMLVADVAARTHGLVVSEVEFHETIGERTRMVAPVVKDK